MKYHLRKSADDKPLDELFTWKQLTSKLENGFVHKSYGICEEGQATWQKLGDAVQFDRSKAGLPGRVARKFSERCTDAYALAGSLDSLATMIWIGGIIYFVGFFFIYGFKLAETSRMVTNSDRGIFLLVMSLGVSLVLLQLATLLIRAVAGILRGVLETAVSNATMLTEQQKQNIFPS
jgi:hypothetical protein